MPIEVKVNGALLGYCHDRFYAVRIGSARDNEIVLADSQVHPYHCTLLHTGSTYRIEVPPSHLVYLNGVLVREGAQFMLDADGPKEGVTLTLGMAPAADELNPSRTVALRYVEVSDLRRNLLRKKRLNRENWQRPFNWLVAAVLAISVVSAGLWTISFLDDQQRDQRIREARVLFDSGEPQRAQLQEDLAAAMVRVGLANKDGAFLPVGTGWLWNAEGQTWLVTNRHVRDQVFNCAEASAGDLADATDCRGMQGACPAAHHYDAARPDAPPILLASCNFDERSKLMEPRLHPDYDRFEQQFPGNGRDDAEVPNIFDVALFDWPAAHAPWGRGLHLASVEERARIAENVATIGFPLEGERAGGILARTWTFRPASVGRLSDPFGTPADEQHFLVLTGSEVQGGESGGPVINEAGNVVGMLFGGYFTKTPGDNSASRLSFGNKVRALDAALIEETARGGQSLAAAANRKALWDVGVRNLGVAFQGRLLEQQVFDTCEMPENIVAEPIGEPKTVSVNRPAGDTAIAQAFQLGLAGSETLQFVRHPGLDARAIQRFVVIVSSSTQDGRVLMQIRRPAGRWISSDSALNSLAAAKDDVQFSGDDTVPVEAVVYSDKQADYTVSVYRIACERKAAPA